MGEVSSRVKVLLIILLAINLLFSSAVLVLEIGERLDEPHYQDQYTLYIGTNDKSTNQQVFSLRECQKRVEQVCMQYVSAFTITKASGFWTKDEGGFEKENTLVCYISGAAADDIYSIADELLVELNQSEIMIVHQNSSTVFRSDKGEIE